MSTKVKKIIFAIVGLLALLKLILLFSTGSIFGIVSYSSWLIWAGLFLTIAFMWFLYGWAFKAMYSFKLIIFLLVGIAVFVFVIGLPTHSIRFGGSKVVNSPNLSSSKSSTPSLVKCASTASDQPTSASGIVTELFASPLDAGRGYTVGVKTNTRIFSLADYANEKANPIKDWRNPIEKTTLKEDIFFYIHKPDNTALPKISGNIQLCDKNNMLMTYPLDYNSPSLTSENSTGGIWYLHGGKLPAEPGDYRVDAYLYSNGKWMLTNRIDKITLTK